MAKILPPTLNTWAPPHCTLRAAPGRVRQNASTVSGVTAPSARSVAVAVGLADEAAAAIVAHHLVLMPDRVIDHRVAQRRAAAVAPDGLDIAADLDQLGRLQGGGLPGWGFLAAKA